MFISYLSPYSVRGIEAPHLWVFYKQLSHFKTDEAIYIGTEGYFRDPAHYARQDRWDAREATQRHHEYTLPRARDVESIRRHVLSPGLFKELEERSGSRQEAAISLLTRRCGELEAELDGIFGEIVKTEEAEAVLAWANCPSLDHVAAKHGLRVIHNELGPLRKPFYTNTAYFDLSGVNGNTESKRRFLRFKKEAGDGVRALPKKELLALLLEADYARLSSSMTEPGYEVGLPLQVEDDSNVLAFSNGLDNRKAIALARGFFKRAEVLIRKHPGGLLDYEEEAGLLDDSANSMDFILKCKRIATINSSVGLESILFDKATWILGDSPFAFLAHDDPDLKKERAQTEDELLGLNFLIFGYLIPYEFLFDADYYRWRLSGPLEKDIFDLHLACYRNKKKAAPWSSSEIPRTDAGILTMKSSLKHQERRTSESAWQVAEKDRRLADKDRQIHSLLNSRSWRMTAPVRALFGFSRGCRDGLLPRCFNRLERLAAPPEIKAVTFDVFDTVLLRDDKPEMRRFFEVAARQAQLLASLGIRRTTEELLHARLVCAKIAYQTAKLNRLERDASLAQMLSLMAHALELDEDLLVGRFAELELEYETENLTGDRELARRLSEIRSRGKKIFFLSDMYFAAGQIRFLLRHFLPDFSYDGGYVSSEHSLTKAGGGLFDRFCEREGFRPEEIVHIGDHYHSDFISPAGRGIRAVWLRRSPARLISRGVKNILARIDFRSLPV